MSYNPALECQRPGPVISLEVWDRPGLQNKFQDSQSNIENPCLGKNQPTKTKKIFKVKDSGNYKIIEM